MHGVERRGEVCWSGNLHADAKRHGDDGLCGGDGQHAELRREQGDGDDHH